MVLNPVVTPGLIRDLEVLSPGGVETDVPLDAATRWRIGGRAKLIVCPGSIEELSRIRAYFHDNCISHAIIGDTSNLLFSDAGVAVPCIHIGKRLSALDIRGAEVFAEAGLWAPLFARKMMQAGLSGTEHICGIPGTLGGLVFMNGGSQRRAIGSSIRQVAVVRSDGTQATYTPNRDFFAYRSSRFQSTRDAIASIVLEFETRRRPAEIRREMLGILQARRMKFPKEFPNCGSVFKSNPAMYADFGAPGFVIERLGLKGCRIGGAEVSNHHANFIVNRGNATARDVCALIRLLSDRVWSETGYRMEVEVRLVAEDGSINAVQAEQ